MILDPHCVSYIFVYNLNFHAQEGEFAKVDTEAAVLSLDVRRGKLTEIGCLDQ